MEHWKTILLISINLTKNGGRKPETTFYRYVLLFIRLTWENDF